MSNHFFMQFPWSLFNILPFSKDNILIIRKSEFDELKSKDLDISDNDSFENSFAYLFSV